MIIAPRERDLGGFTVRRILPFATHRMVGPFIFFDHMGPAAFEDHQGMDVRPHPHINLATVTYLFEGSIVHRDSLGSLQTIEPGAINWMTAGRGIVHSERSPRGIKLHGLQCWVALPKESEEIEPTFVHHPAATLPEFKIGQASCKLLVGDMLGHKSPVKTESDVLYAHVALPADASMDIEANGRDLAVYLITGELQVNGQSVGAGQMMVAESGQNLKIQAQKLSDLMILGGAPLPGDRHIYWNFVSSSKERIERAKDDWRNQRFPKVPGDEKEFIPLPD